MMCRIIVKFSLSQGFLGRVTTFGRQRLWDGLIAANIPAWTDYDSNFGIRVVSRLKWFPHRRAVATTNAGQANKRCQAFVS